MNHELVSVNSIRESESRDPLFEPASSGDIPPLTQSAYESMACPASYQAIYPHGHGSPSTPWGELSNEIHDAMRAYVEHLRAARVDEDWPFLETLMPTLTAEAQEILRGFIGTMRFDWHTILSTELRFYFDDATGKPDLVTLETPSDATIWDYKNYFDIIEPDTFQSRLYPLLLFRHNPNLETVRFVLIFMRYGATREVVWTREQVPFLEKMLADARVRQRAIHETEGLARAVPGRACNYCPLLRTGRCQVASWNPREQMTDEQRLLHVIYLRADAEASSEILRESARFQAVEAQDENGRTYTARFRPAEKRMLAVERGLEVLRSWRDKTGEDLLPKMLLSQTALGPLRKAQKRAELNRQLSEVESMKRYSRFSIDSDPSKTTSQEGAE
jgi:PD-(D/E)XK nuclease superfamily protein